MAERNSLWAGNGCANLWAPRISVFFLQEKPHLSINSLVLGGGGILGFGRGGEVPILFLWARGFFWVFETVLSETVFGEFPNFGHRERQTF